jgi:hypothetical protein
MNVHSAQLVINRDLIWAWKNSIFKTVIRQLGKNFGHILKAIDVKHHKIQKQPDLMILEAPTQRNENKGFFKG